MAERADPKLARAAGNALAKVGAVLPQDLKRQLEDNALLVGSAERFEASVDVAMVREAIRGQRKLQLRYQDEKGAASERVVWPFALGFFERVQVLAAWCEKRQDYRHFRCDRIQLCAPLEERYPRRRQALMRDWRKLQGIAEPK
ncbi:YafY family protein [Chromobacterium sp. IIBBL 290-4]|uniref:helix-turn-helix transcriptional regulator n=1 Tax=Chromobacterium sp. IIBBL 290-4 TaxID=2953890 RepID=UPI0020B841BD|nr:WYL domain-containing protein [Chromobacterium sp. IIBBL 290-4]UTH73519.1 WYL domain-containing protein [Chromobacterium sp. IIBBL 290-4]